MVMKATIYLKLEKIKKVANFSIFILNIKLLLIEFNI